MLCLQKAVMSFAALFYDGYIKYIRYRKFKLLTEQHYYSKNEKYFRIHSLSRLYFSHKSASIIKLAGQLH